MSLELKDVTKRVGADTHIYPTNLTLEPGSFNILLGTTLAGKTTLMQLMAGLETPTQGSIFFNGKDVTGMAVQKRNVSMVYQQFINYPNFTVFENIASPLRLMGLTAEEIKKRVGTMAELLKLTPMLDRKPAELSGGQQQRTALARALVKDSDLVLLDEPLANLDFKLREELRDELPRLFADRDCIVVYATTEPVEALLFGGYTATLFEGRVTQFGKTGETYRTPNTLTTARIFSEPPINTVDVTKNASEFIVDDAIRWPASDAYADLSDGPYTFGIRPHHISPTKAPGTIGINGQVKVAELSGSESIIHFEAFNKDWVCLSHGIHDFAVGANAELYMDVAAGLYFGPDENLIAA